MDESHHYEQLKSTVESVKSVYQQYQKKLEEANMKMMVLVEERATLSQNIAVLKDDIQVLQENASNEYQRINQKVIKNHMMKEEIEELTNIENDNMELKNKIQKQFQEMKKVIEEKNTIQDTLDTERNTLQEMQDQYNLSNKKLLEEKEELQRLIDEKKQLTKNTKESLEVQEKIMKELEQLQELVYMYTEELKAYKTPDPDYAVKRLLIDQNSDYMYNMDSLDSKMKLLECALNTMNYDVIITVVLFLKYSLNPQIFEESVLNKVDAVHHYKRYLKETDPRQYYIILQMTESYKEISMYMFREAINETNNQTKMQKLESCYAYIKEKFDNYKEIPEFQDIMYAINSAKTSLRS
jgi:small-conductance mechanosensitive channel